MKIENLFGNYPNYLLLDKIYYYLLEVFIENLFDINS